MNKISLLAAALLAVCPLTASAQDVATPVTPPAATPTAPAATPTAPTATPTAPTVTLRYKFVPGQTRRYSFLMNMNETILTGQSGAGIPMKIATKMTMTQTVQSVRASDGAATIVARIEEIRMQTNGQDTVLPEAQQAQMKKPFTIVMLPSGKTLSAEMPSVGAGGIPGMDMGKGLFNGTAFLPPDAVKVGDTWSGTVGSAAAGTQKVGDTWNNMVGSTATGTQMAFVSTLTDLSQKAGATLATIAQKQTGTLNMTIPQSQGMPLSMKMAGKITGTGTQVFDTDAGAVQSATGTSSTAVTMTFGKPASGTAPAGMPQAMQMQMQMTFSMQQLPPAAPAAAPAQ